MKTRSQDSSLPFVMLRGIRHNNRFITCNKPGDEHTKLKDGAVAFEVLGYATTIEEAQDQLYENPVDERFAMMKYTLGMMRKLNSLNI